MPILKPSERLKKDLSLLSVYALAVGATLSSGFFLLPGIATREAGPAVVLVYVLVLLPLIPGILCKLELATAMPRAGGEYYFLDRSLGPVFGAIGGLGTWLALVLKVAFALVGMGAYLVVFRPDAPQTTIAVLLALGFGAVNHIGARSTGRFQIVLVLGLLVLLAWFIARGAPKVQAAHFEGFFDRGESILSTIGLVCISYIGLTKVASISEEVRHPEQTLPRAMFLAVGTATIVYAVGTWVMVGVLPAERLHDSLKPVADTAEVIVGHRGAIVMSIAAILAFSSVANAGILSASRYPLAMSRDDLMPTMFQKLGRFGTPVNSIAVTVVLVVATIVLFDPIRIAKLAGAFQLLLFALNCIAVIVMRESRIESYDPGYRTPFYPWLPVIGIIAPLVVIAEMGWLPVAFTALLVLLGVVWYYYYARARVSRQGAIVSALGRLGAPRADELDRELRSILKEKGLRKKDPFDEIVVGADVIDLADAPSFEHLVQRVSERLAARLPCPAETLATGFLEGTRTGATPVTHGVALPHMRIAGIRRPRVALVRCRSGMHLTTGDLLGGAPAEAETFALFFLVSPDEDPGQHLRLLAELASHVDREDFMQRWLDAPDEPALRRLLVRSERFVNITLLPDTPAGALAGQCLRDLDLPEGSLVAIVRRGAESIVPSGRTQLAAGDVLTIIGSASAMRAVTVRFGA